MADKESNPATVETLFNRKAFNHVQAQDGHTACERSLTAPQSTRFFQALR